MSYYSATRSVKCGKINIRANCHRSNMTRANTKISLNILRNLVFPYILNPSMEKRPSKCLCNFFFYFQTSKFKLIIYFSIDWDTILFGSLRMWTENSHHINTMYWGFMFCRWHPIVNREVLYHAPNLTKVHTLCTLSINIILRPKIDYILFKRTRCFSAPVNTPIH